MSVLQLLSKMNHWRLNIRHKLQLENRKKRLKSFGTFAQGLYVETKQGCFVLNPSDSYVAKSLLRDGSYGSHEIELAAKYLTPESICILLGGHIGSIAIPLSKRCKHLEVFEPNPESFKWLSINTAINECNNVTLHNYAVSDNEGELKFIVHEGNSGASRRTPAQRFEPVAFETGNEIRVRTKVLDSLYATQSPDLIFMDIEGSEYFALNGAQDLLSRTRALIMEFDSNHFKLVAGRSSDDVWGTIGPHFSRMHNPKTGEVFNGKDSVKREIHRMLEKNETYENIVFIK